MFFVCLCEFAAVFWKFDKVLDNTTHFNKPFPPTPDQELYITNTGNPRRYANGNYSSSVADVVIAADYNMSEFNACARVFPLFMDFSLLSFHFNFLPQASNLSFILCPFWNFNIKMFTDTPHPNIDFSLDACADFLRKSVRIVCVGFAVSVLFDLYPTGWRADCVTKQYSSKTFTPYSKGSG